MQSLPRWSCVLRVVVPSVHAESNLKENPHSGLTLAFAFYLKRSACRLAVNAETAECVVHADGL